MQSTTSCFFYLLLFFLLFSCGEPITNPKETQNDPNTQQEIMLNQLEEKDLQQLKLDSNFNQLSTKVCEVQTALSLAEQTQASQNSCKTMVETCKHHLTNPLGGMSEVSQNGLKKCSKKATKKLFLSCYGALHNVYKQLHQKFSCTSIPQNKVDPNTELRELYKVLADPDCIKLQQSCPMKASP